MGTAAAPDWLREREGARVADGILKCFSSPPSSHLRGGWGENFKIVGFMRPGGSGESCKTLGEVKALLDSVYKFTCLKSILGHMEPYIAIVLIVL